ncbi:MAG: segregation/condensation protein A [Pseudomonadota bacterium]
MSNSPLQQELPLAIVEGTPITQLPTDLYIPPEALEVFLEAFEGPLDLLLYLIKKQNINILNIPIAKITLQYVKYVEKMHEIKFELAAEYLVMAAMLAEIKSRMLLPKIANDEEDELDPRAELVRRLQEYEQLKQAAEDLDQLPRLERDIFTVDLEFDYSIQAKQPDVEMSDLLAALKDVMSRADKFTHHQIEKDALSVRERMSLIMSKITENRDNNKKFTSFTSLFSFEEGKSGVVVTFLAILELSKQNLLEIVQNESYGLIHVTAN